jgi:ABC-2 type transport system permease protein
MMATLRRELWFMLRDRSLAAWMLVALLLSTAAVAAGIAEVDAQRTTLSRLVEEDRKDRAAQLARQEDWGSAAYYAFHLTYDPPSSLAFAALGERDSSPWKHRIRMLALEGQIHEADVDNPELALIGRLDFSFVAAFLLPLLIIVALHDLHARERQAGRHELLMSMAGRQLWTLRAGLRGLTLSLCILAPFLPGAALSGTDWSTIVSVMTVVVLHAAFWTTLCLLASSLARPAAVILTGLVASWWLLAVLVPAGARAVIDRAVTTTPGARITLLQREAVNAAWDQPKENTMTAFIAAYPEWSDYATIDRPFEWKWYYAFQEVGDLRAARISVAHRESIAERDRWAGYAAWLSPPALVERELQRLAGTDVTAHLRYLDGVRRFHQTLREFHYPLLFRNESFDASRLADLPVYAP